MTQNDLSWETSVTKIEPNKIQLRGYPIDELMGKIPFASAVYLALKGELPTPEIGRLMDIMLVSSVDHGATPPSTLTARTVASTGAPLNACIAAGILAINKFHGGAIENAMRFVKETVKTAEEKNMTLEETALQLVREKREKKQVIHGFGHRVHTRDPRTAKLLAAAEEAGISGRYIEAMKAVQKAIAEVIGKNLPINVDGAIGGILCELDFPPELANAFFIMARVPGLVAQIHEEQTTMKPMRKIHPTNHHYVGPENRHVD
ncbi:MAG: citryl-CoA lyase [Acidobacteria bacterium]|nr:citryl-CoA lyase [Acidobacteriota bacterium]